MTAADHGPGLDVPSAAVWSVRLSTHVWNPAGTAGQALLLHGLGSDGSTWWRVASHLADRGYLVAAPDLRGHGRSPFAHDFRLATLTEDVAALGTGWDLVVGHSLGGAIATLLVGHPDVDVHAAVLVDPVLVVDPDERERLRSDQRADVGTLDADAVAAAHPRWSATDVERKVAAAAWCTPGVVDRVLDHNPDWDVTAAASAGAARLHIVAADPDHGSLLASSVLASVTDGDRVTSEVVAAAGHSVHRDDPDAVLAAVDRALEALV